MARIKYHKGNGLSSVMKRAKPIASIAGPGYERMLPVVAREVRRKRSEYARTEQAADRIIAV